jgi:probable F420-dependent oxidoreductase
MPDADSPRFGVTFPQIEITDHSYSSVARFVREVEAMGFDFLLGYDHVLGVDRERHARDGWTGIYDANTPFLETLVAFSALAATSRLDMITSIMVLPQRQTAMVAKQAATFDAMFPGRLVLGVGVGWNQPEYDALGMDFASRGRRIEEQVELMRRLWSEDVVDHAGEFDRVPGMGIRPRPASGRIPVWFGAGRGSTGTLPPRAAVERIGRMGDGFMTTLQPGEQLDATLAAIREAHERAGRTDAFGLQGAIFASESARDIEQTAAGWRRAGATLVSVNPMLAGESWPDGHLRAIERTAQVLRIS